MNKPECISAVEHEIEQLMPSIGQIKSDDEIAPRISIYVRVCICNGVFINTNAYVYINTIG